MINLNKAEESSLYTFLKRPLLESSKILGCQLSEFEVIKACQKPVCLDSYWVDLVWESDNNLRIRLEFDKKRQADLKQTFKNEPANIPIRWGKGLTPALQFSEGVCQLTPEEVNRLVGQFSLPPLPQPSPDGFWKGIGLKIVEPLFIPGFCHADKENPWIAMGLETRQPDKKYEVRDNNSILRCRFIDNEWVVDFSIKNKLANNQVKIILTDEKTELFTKTLTLVYEDERWRFRYPLPQFIVHQVKNIKVV
jgi:hypothetical protein